MPLNESFHDFISNHFYAPEHWPPVYQRMLFKQHLNNRDRFMITIFFLSNGMNPEMIRLFFWYHGRYDRAAYSQVNWLIDKYVNGDNWGYWTWDVIERRWRIFQ